MSKLKKCPFCGGQAILVEATKSSHASRVKCKNCYCQTDIFQDPRTAREVWNTRKPMQNIVERLEELYDDIPVQYETNYESGIEKGYCDAIEIVKEEGGL